MICTHSKDNPQYLVIIVLGILKALQDYTTYRIASAVPVSVGIERLTRTIGGEELTPAQARKDIWIS